MYSSSAASSALPSGSGIVLDDGGTGIMGAGAMVALREVGAVP